MPDFPVICVKPDAEAFQLLHFRFPTPTWAPEIIAKLQEHVRLGFVPNFFTDGSCQYPGSVLTRFAGFAVVWDLCQTDEERVSWADRCRYQGDFTQAFQPVSSAMSCGEQDILRAELLAICDVVEQFDCGCIYTDSQVALSLASLALTATTLCPLIGKEHLDVLIRMYNRRSCVSFTLYKVKAHKSLSAISNPLNRFVAMGNWFADKLAEKARDDLNKPLVAIHHERHRDLQRKQDHLFALFKLHLLTFGDRGRMLAKVDMYDTQVDHKTTWALFRRWKVDQTAFVIGDTRDHCLQFSAHGEAYSRMTLAWLKAVKWPPDDKGPSGLTVGTSWIEMAVSWMLFNKAYVPVLRKDNKGDLRCFCIGSHTAAIEHSLTFNEAGTMLEKMVRHLQGLIPETLLPPHKRTKTSALYHLGAPKWYEGMNLRIELPCQEETLDIFQMVLRGASSTLGHPPKIEGASGHTGPLEFDWQNRCRIANNGMYKVRKMRRDPDAWDSPLACALLALRGGCNNQGATKKTFFSITWLRSCECFYAMLAWLGSSYVGCNIKSADPA